MQNPKIYDVAIIGAGPIGLFAAFQAGMQGLQAVIVETLAIPGGQCSVLYPEKFIYDVPGSVKITAQNLVDSLLEQTAKFQHEFLYNTQIKALLLDEGSNIFNLRGEIESSIPVDLHAKSVLICAGGGAFVPNKPAVLDLEAFEEKSVFYAVKSKDAFRGKKVAIAGGGDSAVDWAINLADIAEKIYFIHRRKGLRAHQSSLEALGNLEQKGQLEFKIPFMVKSIQGENGIINSLTLENFLDNNIEVALEVDYFLPFFGLQSDLGELASWGFQLEHNRIVVNPNLETTSAGIFAAGDICTYPHKTKLLVSGFHEAAVAMESINARMIQLFGKAAQAFSFSTSKF